MECANEFLYANTQILLVNSVYKVYEYFDCEILLSVGLLFFQQMIHIRLIIINHDSTYKPIHSQTKFISTSSKLRNLISLYAQTSTQITLFCEYVSVEVMRGQLFGSVGMLTMRYNRTSNISISKPKDVLNSGASLFWITKFQKTPSCGR